MILLLQIAAAVALSPADSSMPAPIGPRDLAVGVTREALPDTTPRVRKRATQISDQYATRLKIHQVASYATIPLFAAQLIVGSNLYNADSKGAPRPAWAQSAHKPLAYALGGLFAVNTVTGTMNWWETRNQTEGRTWRTIHAALMLASDAGFAYTGSMGGSARSSFKERDKHRQWALASSSVALLSYAMMLSPFRQE